MADCLIKCIWDSFLKPHVDYWWCFDDNIQQLIDGIRVLEWRTHDIQQKIEVARLRAQIVRPEVQEWLKSSNDKLEEAKTTFPNDNTPEAWKLISRYSLGKNAKETAEEIAKLLNGGVFNGIADPAPPMDFESRKHIVEEIIDSLKQYRVNMIGICGMEGVGKTTMAQIIGKRVKDENLFDEIVMVTVSQTIDMLKIQDEIAELLGLKFDAESFPVRTHQLRIRLMNDTKRKLIIFDDVWESLRFDNLGIPIESNFERCKVLLTSPSRDTCEKIKSKKVFELKTLDEKEAWILFKDKAGHYVEDLVLHPWAKAIVAECKGLPIALVTVGLALQNEKEERIWKYSLSKLKESIPTDFYGKLKFSYEMLGNDLEKRFFLLCCLFPEDYNIPLEELTWYWMGLQMFDDISTIEERTCKTHTLVGKLKRRFLLIDGPDKLHVKMHDVVRDVGIYIGSKKEKGFLKSLSSIKNSSDDNCNWMSVNISNERMEEVPVVLRFPKLQLLMWSSKAFYDISHLSFVGMEDLKVLSFEHISVGSLPTTLESLTHLQTLRLRDCKVENISVIGKLTSLKILSCYRCENITELPAEIGSLSGLRLLELSECKLLQTIPFGVISSLRLLEELKMRGSFSRWEAEENGKEKRNASLRELECLLNLSWLEIEIDDCNLSSQEICLSQNLVKYYIRIGDFDSYYWYDDEVRDYEKVMILNLGSDIGAVGRWIQKGVRNSEGLYLKGDGWVSNNLNIAEIKHLRNLKVEKCSTLKKLVKFGTVFPLLETLTLEGVGNLQEICDLNQNVFSGVSFCNLKSIFIKKCHNLRYLFSVSVATTCLPQLEELDIEDCDSMEHVFWSEIRNETYGYIELPKLKKLTLENLQKLNSISLTDVSFCNLKSIVIRKCDNLRYLLSVSVATTFLPRLEDLDIEDCDSMERVFWNEIRDDNNTYGCIEFPNLEKLTIGNLPNLTVFCQGLENIIINFPNLSELKIGRLPSLKYSFFPLNSEIPCSLKSIPSSLKSIYISGFSNLKHLFSRSVATTILLQLEVLCIEDCEAMEGVFWNDDREDNPDGCIELSKLKKLSLYDLPNFTAFCPGLENIIINFSKLTEMKIGRLPKLNSVFPLHSETVDEHHTTSSLCNPKIVLSLPSQISL